jgi:hypothetical protein
MRYSIVYMSIILTHLGEHSPPYLRDCVHQIRLWNPETKIYLILWRCHESSEFWAKLVAEYKVILVYTDTLEPTPHHRHFSDYYLRNPSETTQFRKGYWIHVKERFFFVEELMLRDHLEQCISMEYDVLVYVSLEGLFEKLKASHQTLRMVRDNDERGHPGFLYVPTAESIGGFNEFLASVVKTGMEDMQSLVNYADSNPDTVHYLPVITEARNRGAKRISAMGHTTEDPSYLSEDSEHFGVLFDSAVVGQWVGGIDSRNTGGKKVSPYANESALYGMHELQFGWQKLKGLWKPLLDEQPLATIHMHSKALRSFLSDRKDTPCDDYEVEDISKDLVAK